MLNTFFFGYLELKWKRLVRVLSIGAIAIFTLIFLIWIDEMGPGPTDGEAFLILLLGLVLGTLLIGLISWVLKPFIVKD